MHKRGGTPPATQAPCPRYKQSRLPPLIRTNSPSDVYTPLLSSSPAVTVEEAGILAEEGGMADMKGGVPGVEVRGAGTGVTRSPSACASSTLLGTASAPAAAGESGGLFVYPTFTRKAICCLLAEF